MFREDMQGEEEEEGEEGVRSQERNLTKNAPQGEAVS